MNRAEDLFREIMDAQVFWFPCAAEVVSFDKATQTASVRPAVTIGGTAAPEVKGALVLMPSGGGWEMDFDLQAGDHVLAVFAAHNVSLWGKGSPTGAEMGQPRLSDAVIIPGLARVTGRTADTTAGLTLRNRTGTVELSLSEGGVEVKGNLTVTGDVVAGAITPATEISLLTHVHPVGSPNTSGPIPAP